MNLESLTLGALVTAIYQHDSPAVQQEAMQAALADPGAALTCYTIIVDVRDLPPADDDRRTCRQCANLKDGICSIASPGGVVSAQNGYRPGAMFLEYPHRCEAFNERGAK